jgi:hypothetical protein
VRTIQIRHGRKNSDASAELGCPANAIELKTMENPRVRSSVNNVQRHSKDFLAIFVRNQYRVISVF